jgi:hypothetical protein
MRPEGSHHYPRNEPVEQSPGCSSRHDGPGWSMAWTNKFQTGECVVKGSENYIPPKIQNLSIKEIFLFTGIPLYLLEGFATGKFKPSEADCERLTDLARPFYKLENSQIRDYVDRKKFRELRPFISFTEKQKLLSLESHAKYRKKLNELLDKHFDQIAAKILGN